MTDTEKHNAEILIVQPHEDELLDSVTVAVQEFCKEKKLKRYEAQRLIARVMGGANEAFANAYHNYSDYRDLMGKED